MFVAERRGNTLFGTSATAMGGRMSSAAFDRQTLVKVAVIAAIVAVDTAWVMASDFRFHVASAGKVVAVVAALALVAWFYRTRRPVRVFEILCTETAILLAFSASGVVLSYLVTSLNFPLIDGHLVAFDALIGFDWTDYVAFVNQHPVLGMLSSAVYVTTLSQVALAIIVISLAGKPQRAQQFVSAVIVSALVCIAISGVLPSAGALATFRPDVDFVQANAPLVDLAYKQTFFDLRSGAERFISLDGARGLIAFPSYHCALSVLIVMAFRGLGYWFWPVFVLNAAIVLSTPVDGGHHLSDAIGGCLVAVFAWIAVARCYRSNRAADAPALQPAE